VEVHRSFPRFLKGSLGILKICSGLPKKVPRFAKQFKILQETSKKEEYKAEFYGACRGGEHDLAAGHGGDAGPSRGDGGVEGGARTYSVRPCNIASKKRGVVSRQRRIASWDAQPPWES